MKTLTCNLEHAVIGWAEHLFAPLASLFQIGVEVDDYFIEISLGESLEDEGLLVAK